MAILKITVYFVRLRVYVTGSESPDELRPVCSSTFSIVLFSLFSVTFSARTAFLSGQLEIKNSPKSNFFSHLLEPHGKPAITLTGQYLAYKDLIHQGKHKECCSHSIRQYHPSCHCHFLLHKLNYSCFLDQRPNFMISTSYPYVTYPTSSFNWIPVTDITKLVIVVRTIN